MGSFVCYPGILEFIRVRSVVEDFNGPVLASDPIDS